MSANPWTDYEDNLLRKLVNEHGAKKWTLIASKLKSRGSKQCRRRWNNFLNADLKQGDWSPEEDRILMEGHKRYGNKWTEIAKLVGGRTDNAVKNRWAALCKRTQPRGGGGSGGGGGSKGGSKGGAKGRGAARRGGDDDSDDESDDSDESGGTPLTQSPRFASTGARGTRAAQAAAAQQQQLAAAPPPVAYNLASAAAAAVAAAPRASPFGQAAAASLYQSNAAAVGSKRQAPGQQLQDAQQQQQAKRLHLAGGSAPAFAFPAAAHNQQSVQPLDLRPVRSPRLQARQQFQPSHGLGSLGFTSPRTAAVLAAAGLSGPAHTAGRLLVGGAAAPPRGGAPQQQPLQLGVGATAAAAAAAATPVSPGGSKKPRPELTLLIPNGGAAEPPAPAQQQQGAQGLQIHVSKELLSPAEVRYAQELNEMEGIPLHIKLEDLMEEPPLSTSRRAAQDALSALVADTPTGAHHGGAHGAGGQPSAVGAGPSLGPLTLNGVGLGGGGAGGGGSSTELFGLMSATTPGGDVNELLRWLQQNGTPRTARPGTARGAGGGAVAAASPFHVASPRPATRAAAKLTTPKGAAAAEGQQGKGAGGTTPRRAAQGGQQQQAADEGVQLQEGHRQLLAKLLHQARTGNTPKGAAGGAEGHAPASAPSGDALARLQSGGPSGAAARSSPRLAAATLRSPKPWNSGPAGDAHPAPHGAQQQQQTGAQAAAALLSLPMPGAPLSATGRRTRHGGLTPVGGGGAQQQRAHPGPGGGLALGGLASPALASARGGSASGGAWNGLDVLLTPAITNNDIDQLLEMLGADE